MTVYVDDMRASFRRMIMCHMIADRDEELHAMAGAIGVARRWYQGDHYDICLSMRAKAVALGAREIRWKDTGMMIWFRRMGMPMPRVEDAQRLFFLARS